MLKHSIEYYTTVAVGSHWGFLFVYFPYKHMSHPHKCFYLCWNSGGLSNVKQKYYEM